MRACVYMWLGGGMKDREKHAHTHIFQTSRICPFWFSCLLTAGECHIDYDYTILQQTFGHSNQDVKSSPGKHFKNNETNPTKQNEQD